MPRRRRQQEQVEFPEPYIGGNRGTHEVVTEAPTYGGTPLTVQDIQEARRSMDAKRQSVDRKQLADDLAGPPPGGREPARAEARDQPEAQPPAPREQPPAPREQPPAPREPAQRDEPPQARAAPPSDPARQRMDDMMGDTRSRVEDTNFVDQTLSAERGALRIMDGDAQKFFEFLESVPEGKLREMLYDLMAQQATQGFERRYQQRAVHGSGAGYGPERPTK